MRKIKKLLICLSSFTITTLPIINVVSCGDPFLEFEIPKKELENIEDIKKRIGDLEDKKMQYEMNYQSSIPSNNKLNGIDNRDRRSLLKNSIDYQKAKLSSFWINTYKYKINKINPSYTEDRNYKTNNGKTITINALSEASYTREYEEIKEDKSLKSETLKLINDIYNYYKK